MKITKGVAPVEFFGKYISIFNSTPSTVQYVTSRCTSRAFARMSCTGGREVSSGISNELTACSVAGAGDGSLEIEVAGTRGAGVALAKPLHAIDKMNNVSREIWILRCIVILLARSFSPCIRCHRNHLDPNL